MKCAALHLNGRQLRWCVVALLLHKEFSTCGHTAAPPLGATPPCRHGGHSNPAHGWADPCSPLTDWITAPRSYYS